VNATQPPRWHPRVIVKRWAFLLWLTPLVALLTSLIWHLLEFRQDSVAGVIQLSSPALSSPMGIPALVRSPEVMGAVVKELDLPSRWKLSEEQAALRLESLVSCRLLKVSSRALVEVQESADHDALQLCEAVLRHSVAQHRAAFEQRISEDLVDLASGRPAIQTSLREIDAAEAKLAALEQLHGANSLEAREQAKALDLMQKTFDMYLEGHVINTVDTPLNQMPAMIYRESSRQATPWSERLRDFGRSAGSVLWGALLLALALAYLAESLEPRGTMDEALPAT